MWRLTTNITNIELEVINMRPIKYRTIIGRYSFLNCIRMITAVGVKLMEMLCLRTKSQKPAHIEL